uniref:Uncharacterized protein n=1 Tax=Oryza brachyantha TaxID=4533 RepID=J3N603_ORYBR
MAIVLCCEGDKRKTSSLSIQFRRGSGRMQLPVHGYLGSAWQCHRLALAWVCMTWEMSPSSSFSIDWIEGSSTYLVLVLIPPQGT